MPTITVTTFFEILGAVTTSMEKKMLQFFWKFPICKMHDGNKCSKCDSLHMTESHKLPPVCSIHFYCVKTIRFQWSKCYLFIELTEGQ